MTKVTNQTVTPAVAFTCRQRFLNACHCQSVDRPPVWLMRQAGRALPEYRKLKETYTFVQLVQNPELAAEVTLQPVRRFGFDAAILFSDILVIPEAMGQAYHFKETGGVQMDFAVTSKADIERLSVSQVCDKLSYVDQALRILRRELGEQTALIGFSGSPWTLATFMMEGASVPKYGRALALFREDPKTYFALAEKLTAAVTAYLKMQIAAGVDAVQIFDSHGGHLLPSEFQEASGRWMREIISALRTPHSAVPIIQFSLGTHGNWPDLVASGANVLGIDWQTSLADVRRIIPEGIGLQGNLPPALIVEATPEVVARETKATLEAMRGRAGHIFNLGHGLTPGAKLENIAALVETVRSFQMKTLSVDLKLVKKYNVAGPRYTSYPPATKFTDTISWEQLSARIDENNRTPRDLSVYFHIPFCETLCWFCGCTTVITLNHSKGMAYVETLGREVAKLATQLNPARKVVQLHFGGGTPTFLQPDEIRRLGEIIHRHFTFSPDIEAGVEIDPRRLTREHLVALREVGFNRASMGVQDFNPQVQAAVHRIQPRAMTQQAIDWMRELGFGSINLDLIYGLPHQTPESFNETLDTVLEMKPDRLAVFSYAHVPWIKPSQKILEQKVLPTPESKLEVLKLVIERLTADNQYVYIGMDHFAKPDDELAVAQRNKQLQRNFQGYSTRAGSDIYSFGMSAISQIPDAYWQNEKELPQYQAAVDAARVPLHRAYFLTDEDQLRRETIMRVLCDLSLDFAAMSQKLGVNFEQHFASELSSLAPFESDGLVKRTPSGLEVTDAGRLFILNIAMTFDNTLAPAGERRHSKTI